MRPALRRFPLLASLLFLLGCALPGLVTGYPKASLYVLGGEVLLRQPEGDWQPATSCFVLQQGYGVRTESDGEALVSLAGGGKLFLDVQSEFGLRALAFVDTGQSAPLYNLALPRGSAYLESPGQGQGIALLSSPSAVAGVYHGNLWYQSEPAGGSVSLELINGQALLAQVGSADPPAVRVIRLVPRSSAVVTEVSPLPEGAQLLLDAVSLLLAAGPGAFDRLSAAGSLEAALTQLAQDAAQDPDLAARLTALGIPLPDSETLPASQLALLDLRDVSPDEWPALLDSSPLGDAVELQPLDTPAPPSLIQQVADLAPPSGTPEADDGNPGNQGQGAGGAPGQQQDRGQSGERPACGRDAGKPPVERGPKNPGEDAPGALRGQERSALYPS